jgi:hypothetical protein
MEKAGVSIGMFETSYLSFEMKILDQLLTFA